jgi:hypothetical protein
VRATDTEGCGQEATDTRGADAKGPLFFAFLFKVVGVEVGEVD